MIISSSNSPQVKLVKVGYGLILAAMATMVGSACSKKSSSPSIGEPPGITVPSGNLPRPQSGAEGIPYMGGVISTRVIAGRVFIPVQGTYSDGSFAALSESFSAEGLGTIERSFVMRNELSSDLKTIGKSMPVLQVKVIPEVGFFSALIPFEGYERLGEVKGLSHRILINPVISMPAGEDLRGLKPAHLSTLGIHSSGAARGDLSSFSGLARIGVKDFLAKVKEEIGAVVDGSSVKVGVTDTGITFNHPAFLDAEGKNRIRYMKDFTAEGQVYFVDSAKFEAREPKPEDVPTGANPAEVVVVSADYIIPPKGRTAPVADVLSQVSSQVFLVSSELKSQLLTAGSGARLGVLSEEAFATSDKSEVVDLNHNGKTDDVLWVLLIPNQDVAQSKVFVDVSGRGDFRKSPALADFNSTKSTMKIYSETPGFEIKSIELLASDGNTVSGVAAAIVGFDPGNHGSHVSGIIGGRKTIANDTDDTEARGVAPNTTIMMNRVCANNGGCDATEAIIDLALNGAEVVNMSLGGLSPMNDGYGVQETVINRLTSLKNTLFVVSAGNSGPGHQTIGSPSTARFALSVAATGSRQLIERQYQWPASGKPRTVNNGDQDFLMFFSSRGPTAAGGFKPNISAPGTELSSIQLNSADGSRPGLDIYWGTSMAAPTATGAIALLIDAAKQFNARHPSEPLPLDAMTLHRVVTESAVPFDVNTYDVKTHKRSHGQYTWIDQGQGMINISKAWDALKAARDTKIPSAVYFEENGRRVDVDLDYQVRVLRKSPDGQDYTGSSDAPIDTQGGKEPKFGRGIYLDYSSTDSLIGVQIARRLPTSVLKRGDVGDLARLLNTTADTFELETIFHGSAVEWLKAGVLAQLDCVTNSSSRLTIVGPGAVDNFQDPKAPSSGLQASTLQVCVNRSLISTLPPGDHGALIKAFRIAGGRREAQPAFLVPVYLAVPHAVMAGQATYKIERLISSFEVQRHYVHIPSGTSAVKVTMTVPEARVMGSSVSGCSGVELMVLEAQNTAVPTELSPRAKARAANCDAKGPTPEKRVISYSRLNPKAGLWDLHVFGQYMFKDSPYQLTIEFAKVKTSVAEITGTTDALIGSFNIDLLEGSGSIVPDSAKTTFVLNAFVQESSPTIKQDQELRVLDSDNSPARVYDESVATVEYSTGGMPGSDIDLSVLECKTNELNDCKTVGASGGASDEEKVVITPDPKLFYVAVVSGYTVVNGPAAFTFKESRKLKATEAGSVQVAALSDSSYKIDFAFDSASSKILASPIFQTKKVMAAGDIVLRTGDNFDLVRIPVKVSAP